MALSPEQLAQTATTLNGFYGEGTIDTDGDLQAQITAFLSEKTAEYETKLAALAETPNPLIDFSTLGPLSTIQEADGEWDPSTATQLYTALLTTAGIAEQAETPEALAAQYDALRTQLAEDTELTDQEKETALANINAEQEIITATLDTFPPAELGLLISVNDAIHGQDTIATYEATALTDFKLRLNTAIDSGIFGDITNFDPSIETTNPVEEGYTNTILALNTVLTDGSLTPEILNERALTLLETAVIPTLPQEQQDGINALDTTEDKLNAVFQLQEITNPVALQTLQSIGFSYDLISKGQIPQMAAAITAQAEATPAAEVTPETSGPDAPAPDPEAESEDAQAEDTAPETIDPRTQLANPDLVSLVEMAYARAFESERLVPESDGFYDMDVQNFVRDTVQSLFDDYAHGRIDVTVGDQNYIIANGGTIYKAELVNGELVQGERDGHITDGLTRRDNDGQTRRPHEATTAFLETINTDLNNGAITLRASGIPEEDAAQLDGLADLKEEEITAFFNSSPDLAELEDEFRAALNESRGLGLERFLQTGLARRMKNAAADEDIFDAFVIVAFANESRINGYGADFAEFDLQRDTAGVLSRFVTHLTNDPNYDPNAINTLAEGTYAGADNVLAIEAYDILEFARGGDHILTSALYDEANVAQKAEVLKSFGDRESVTREEVYEFVKRQIDLRAIEELDPDITQEDIDALETVEAQNAFIAQNAATLQGVSQAIVAGRFNPYEKDMHAAFRADPRPTLADPATQNAINFHRNNGTIPPAAYAFNTMSDSELRELTGREDFTTLDRNEQTQILDNVLGQPIENFVGNAAFERVTLNFYEDIIADYTYDRNEAWNDTYGEMTRDQLMMTYLSQNWGRHADIFGEETSSMFFQTGQRAYLNYNLTYDEAVANMTPDQIAILDRGIESVSNTSMYQHMLVANLGNYRNLRNNEYIPRQQEIALQEQFAATAQDNEDAAPTPPAPEPDPAAPVTGDGEADDGDPDAADPDDDAPAGPEITEDTVPEVSTIVSTLAPLPETETNPGFVNPVKGDPTLSIPRAIASGTPRLTTPDLPVNGAALESFFPAPEPVRLQAPEITQTVAPEAPTPVASASGTATAEFVDEINVSVPTEAPDTPSTPRAPTAPVVDTPPTTISRITTPIITTVQSVTPPPRLNFNEAAIDSLFPAPEPTRIIVDAPSTLPPVINYESPPLFVDFEGTAPPAILDSEGRLHDLDGEATRAAVLDNYDADGRLIDPSTRPLPSNLSLVITNADGNLPALAKAPTIDPPTGLGQFFFFF